VSIVSGPTPPRYMLGNVQPVSFVATSTCFAVMQLRFTLDNSTHMDSVVSFTTDTQQVTVTPPASATAAVVPLEVSVISPVSELLLGTFFEYYEDPVVTSVTPAIVHADRTTVSVCGTGIVAYNWAVPVCKFGNVQVPGTISGGCMSCQMASDLQCTERPNVTVSIALYPDQYVLAGSVELVCLQLANAYASPASIFIEDAMDTLNSTVFADFFYATNYMRCKFFSPVFYPNGLFTEGTFVSKNSMKCRVPKVNAPCVLDLSVTMNGQDYVTADSVMLWVNAVTTCPPGAEIDGLTCVPCGKGEYKEEGGAHSCKACGSRMTTSTTGSTSIFNCTCDEYAFFMDILFDHSMCTCKAGYYLATACMPCPVGTYKSEVRTGACVACATRRTTADTGSTTPSQCVCIDDYYEKDGECVPCASGATCKGGRPPISQGGYAASEEGVFVECLPAGACEADNKCAAGYSGERCSSCADGYYRSQLECVACAGTGLWWVLVLVVPFVVVGIGYLLRKALNGPSSSSIIAAICITLSFLQVCLVCLCVLSVRSLRWLEVCQVQTK